MKNYKFFLLATLALISATDASVKNTYTLSKDYTVTIQGTSNLHAWDESVKTVTGNGVVSWNTDKSFNLDAINIKMAVTSIKSKEGSIMNNKTYKALKADDHPEIILALAAPITSVKDNQAATTISAKCNLTIAGVTKPVVIQVKVSMPQKGTMEFAGAQTIKMTDYGVDPPTALFGALKTGDDITIQFKTSFSVATN